MQHPFELKITDLQAIDFEIVDLTEHQSPEIVGGTATIGRGLEQGGGGGSVTADGVGPNEVGGPLTPGPFTPRPNNPTTLALGEEGGGWATTLAVGEEGGGIGCNPRHPYKRCR